MAEVSKIEWTESSWNPVTGCTKVTEGCKNCYAFKLSARLKAMHNPRYQNGFEVTVHDDLIDLPLRWKKSRRIFVNSMSDIFHEAIPDETIIRIFEIMNKASWHTFQVLTKREERMLTLSKSINWSKNIWMGVTVENKDALKRVEMLKRTDAYVKFISAEPLLESLEGLHLDGVDWIIVGGESGPNARPMLKEWVTSIQENAIENQCAFFFKQWGGKNKKRAGRLLNEQEYSEYPVNK